MEKIDNLLLCIGAQKAGTSWLAKMLGNHDDIKFSKYKEIHYFDYIDGLNNQLPNRLLSNIAHSLTLDIDKVTQNIFNSKQSGIESMGKILDDNWYINQFTMGSRYLADFTPEYALISNESFQHIKTLSTSQKIIFIMREPIGRTLSAIQYFYQNRNIDIDSIEPETLKKRALSELFISRSKYEATLEKIKLNFSDEDVLYLFYEDMMQDKQSTLNKVTNFLNIDPIAIESTALNKKVNSSKGYNFPQEIITTLEIELEETISKVNEHIGYIPKEWRRL